LPDNLVRTASESAVKRILAIAFVPACLGLTQACETTPNASTVSSSQVGAQHVHLGEVVALRPMEIKPGTTRVGAVTGAILGGIGGSQIGGGTAANVAGGVVGAVAGGLLGSAIQRGGQTQQGVEVTVRLESGEVIAVTQPGSVNEFRVGDRVRVVGDNDEARVTR
jgi:outer membrane lipoprotein SlyB